MKAVIQRVKSASVSIQGKEVSKIDCGLLVLLGIADEDGKEDIDWLSKKIINMRVFSDEAGQMNKSVEDVQGGILAVSQFTLHASTKKGNRPSFIKAAKPTLAIPLYEQFVAALEAQFGGRVQTGKFGADMQVSLINDGPVTIVIDTKNRV